MTTLTDDLEIHQYAYLITRGRSTGRRHRIEIWFVVIEGALWVASGGRGRSDWVRNLTADHHLDLEIGPDRWPATGVQHPDLAAHPARQRLAGRYQHWQPGEPLSEWATNSMLIEVAPIRASAPG